MGWCGALSHGGSIWLQSPHNPALKSAVFPQGTSNRREHHLPPLNLHLTPTYLASFLAMGPRPLLTGPHISCRRLLRMACRPLAWPMRSCMGCPGPEPGSSSGRGPMVVPRVTPLGLVPRLLSHGLGVPSSLPVSLEESGLLPLPPPPRPWACPPQPVSCGQPDPWAQCDRALV